MTKGEEMFLDQFTRKLMVELCRSQMVHGDPFRMLLIERHRDARKDYEPFLDYAVTKKWLNADRTKVLNAGWMTAARFLKR